MSAWASWESTILEYLYAIGSSAKMQVVYNTRFGELWEDRGDTEDEESLLSRREEYPAELPDGVLVLTAGVDTQDDRFEYEIVGHGHFGETWGIEAGIIMGRPDLPETWAKLDDAVFNRILRFQNGVGLPISLTFIDEGGHFTQDVRQECQKRVSKNVYAVAGSNNFKAPFTSPPKKRKITVNQRVIGFCWGYDIGVSAGKKIIMDDLKVKPPDNPKEIKANYCHFPLRDDYGPGYFAGLLSEYLDYDTNKQQPWVWKKIPGHERNERLDCRNYALAAFKVLPKDLDAIDRRLKMGRGEKPPEGAPKAPAVKKRRQRDESHPANAIMTIGKEANRTKGSQRRIRRKGDNFMPSKTEIQTRLAFYRAALEKMQKAYLALISGGVKSYRIDDRQLTRFDIPALLSQIEATERKVDELEALAAGKGSRKAYGIIPRDL